MFVIYMLTNPNTMLSYIGLTNDLKTRIRRHKSNLTVKCKDFTVDVLFDNIPSRSEASEMEKVFIDVHQTFDNGYNQTRGGSTHTEYSYETKQKMSENNKCENNPFYGKNHTDETKRKMSDIMSGENHHHYGKSPSEKTRAKMRAAQQRLKSERISKGEDHHNKGRKHSNEAKHKMSLKRRGKDNPSYGKIPSKQTRKKISDAHKGDKHWKRRKRLKAEWMYVRSLAMCWYEMHEYVTKRRSEFYDIPDTSNASQLSAF